LTDEALSANKFMTKKTVIGKLITFFIIILFLFFTNKVLTGTLPMYMYSKAQSEIF